MVKVWTKSYAYLAGQAPSDSSSLVSMDHTHQHQKDQQVLSANHNNTTNYIMPNKLIQFSSMSNTIHLFHVSFYTITGYQTTHTCKDMTWLLIGKKHFKLSSNPVVLKRWYPHPWTHGDKNMEYKTHSLK